MRRQAMFTTRTGRFQHSCKISLEKHMISLKNFSRLVLLILCAISLNGYAQDSTNTEELTFTEIKPEVVDSTIKATDTVAKIAAPVPAVTQKTIAQPKKEHKT